MLFKTYQEYLDNSTYKCIKGPTNPPENVWTAGTTRADIPSTSISGGVYSLVREYAKRYFPAYGAYRLFPTPVLFLSLSTSRLLSTPTEGDESTERSLSRGREFIVSVGCLCHTVVTMNGAVRDHVPCTGSCQLLRSSFRSSVEVGSTLATCVHSRDPG